jgi:hypothetical protein
MSLTAKLSIVLTHVLSQALDLSTPVDSFRLDLSRELADGTDDDQVDRAFADRREAVAAPDDIDLRGALVNALGATVQFATVKALVIRNRATVAGRNLTVGGATNAFASFLGGAAHKIVIPPGGVCILTAPLDGYAVTAGTGDILRLDPGSATVEYDLYILGTSE